MEQKKFEALLVLIIPEVVRLIIEKYKCDEVTAVREFYSWNRKILRCGILVR